MIINLLLKYDYKPAIKDLETIGVKGGVLNSLRKYKSDFLKLILGNIGDAITLIATNEKHPITKDLMLKGLGHLEKFQPECLQEIFKNQDNTFRLMSNGVTLSDLQKFNHECLKEVIKEPAATLRVMEEANANLECLSKFDVHCLQELKSIRLGLGKKLQAIGIKDLGSLSNFGRSDLYTILDNPKQVNKFVKAGKLEDLSEVQVFLSEVIESADTSLGLLDQGVKPSDLARQVRAKQRETNIESTSGLSQPDKIKERRHAGKQPVYPSM